MSNIKTQPAEWAIARKLFESGKLLRVISEKTGIRVPALSKRAKRDNWRKQSVDTAPLNLSAEIGKQIKMMAGYGLMDIEIAAVLGINLDILRANFDKELITASPEMVARVAQSMFRMATDSNKPNVTAAIFWLKCRAGWCEESEKTAGMGKKEQRQYAAAKVAAGRFAPAAPPRLVVNNK